MSVGGIDQAVAASETSNSSSFESSIANASSSDAGTSPSALGSDLESALMAACAGIVITVGLPIVMESIKSEDQM
jgi:hypothetical protein